MSRGIQRPDLMIARRGPTHRGALPNGASLFQILQPKLAHGEALPDADAAFFVAHLQAHDRGGMVPVDLSAPKFTLK